MVKKALKPLLCIFVFLFALHHAQPAFAHGGEPRLEISLERINPGGVLDVRGVEFDYEQSVTLYLERTGIVVQLGQVFSDLEGIFLYTVVLPVDLPEGVYKIRAVNSHHDVLSPALAVQGSAILSEGSDQREASEGLLAPMPTFAPGVSSTPLPQTTALETPAPQGSSTPFIYSILVVIGTIALLGLRILKRR
jgi:hypothetical protein